MEDAPLKKLVVVGGHQIELYSLDGMSWSSNLRELRERERQRQKDAEREKRYAQRIFKRAKGYLDQL